MYNRPSDEESDIKQAVPTFQFKGSFKQAFITNAFVAYTGLSIVGVFGLPVSQMKLLNKTLQGLLASSPILMGMLTSIPMTYYIGKHGGKKQTLVLIGSAFVGMTMATTLSLVTDITKIDHFDWRYATMLTSGYLIGCGTGLFQLLINILKWTESTDYFSTIQSVYSSIVDSSTITTPIVVYSLKNYSISFGIYTSVIFLGGIAALAFLIPSPHDQLKKHFTNEEADRMAKEYGQLESMIYHDTRSVSAIAKDYVKTLFTTRGIILNFAMFSTLGSYLVTGTIFPSLLINGYNVSTANSIYLSAFANGCSILSRLVGGKMVAKWDAKSGGIKIFALGAGLTIAAAIPVAFINNLQTQFLYPCIGIMNVGFGMSLMPPLNISRIWSKPVNEEMKKYNPNDMFGLLGTIGTLGGIILPVALGLLVDEVGDKGYQYYFIIIMAMMLVSAVAIPLVNHDVVNAKENSLFNKAHNFFSGIYNNRNTSKYTFDNKNDDNVIDLPHTVMKTA